ncbi:hypothetical protein J7438_08275 [Thalassotalea sp. G20_0]|uniref:hypothetical protein n=1 Tax=Thalassotalea sp. G20_0 TaxID=2821093 RepID=UPI001ADCF951|nr:hypothetical protein [Thalassotalea sp. G20_0]MBO9494080.1 hypothetical protein [Thalassotalea sp. G20_0]
MTSPISASTYPKMAWQEQQDPEKTKDATENTGVRAKFKNLSVEEVVPQASSEIPTPDLHPFKSQYEKDCIEKSMYMQSVTPSSGPPPLEFRHMRKIERQHNTLMHQDMMKYQLSLDGIVQKENYSECDNTVKEFTGVYVFNDIDLNHGRQLRPHKNFGPKDPHSIHAGQFDDGTFFLLALNPTQCERLFKADSHNNVGYCGESYLATSGGENTHSLYCGKTYKEALVTFELACRDTIVANNIRKSLGFESD